MSGCAPLHQCLVPPLSTLTSAPGTCAVCSTAKLEDGTSARNLKIWDTTTAQEIASFERKSQEGWCASIVALLRFLLPFTPLTHNLSHATHSFFQFTSAEDLCVRQVSTELQVYDPRAMDKGVIGRLRLEGMTSFELGPGERPSVAVFCGEKKVSARAG